VLSEQASAIGGLLDYPPEVGQRWVTYFSTFWVSRLLNRVNLLPHMQRELHHQQHRYFTSGDAVEAVWLLQGAWAFLIGSYFQLLEALNKQPTKVGQESINE
jgi:hypothetical protein